MIPKTAIKVKAQLLSKEIELYHFTICSVVWYDPFCQIHYVKDTVSRILLHFSPYIQETTFLYTNLIKILQSYELPCFSNLAIYVV